MTNTIIWHNPRCSKSRQTLQLLWDKGIAPVVVDYITHPPTKAEIIAALDLLNIAPIALMRTGEKIFKEAGLTKTDTADTLIAAMCTHPILIERPVVLHNGKAAIGRPPEAVLDIL